MKMKTKLISLAFAASAVGATACAANDNRPAQEPSSATTTAATTDVTFAAPEHRSTELPASPRAFDNGTAPAAPTATGTVAVEQSGNTLQPFHASTPGATDMAATGTLNPGPAPSPAAPVDNTKINARDRGDTLTPANQGNSDAEVKITAAIRRGMMGDKTLSFTAKNTKVITTGTKVTLRGPVKSEQEKSTIEALARQTPGVTDVDNQLEVK